ncbi:MAG: hypothetical protein QOF21_17 [Actinomycetota bacterium]
MAIAALLATSCGNASRSELDAAQCRLVTSATVGHALVTTSPPGVLVDHEKDRDGTWCLFDTAVGRVETRFQPTRDSEFAARRGACLRDGATSHEVAEVDGLLFCSDGIPSAVGFTKGFMITVHALELTDAETHAIQVAEAALARCCPATNGN